MRKRRWKWMNLFLILLLILSMAVPVVATGIQDAKDEKTRLETKKKQAQSRINDLEKEKGNIEQYIQKLDKELNSLNAEIDRLNGEIEQTNAELETTQEELEEAKQTEKNQYATMKKRIKYMYENGNEDYIDVILSSNSISDLLNRTEYIAKISEYDQGMLERYQDAKKAVEIKEKELEDKIAELGILREEVEVEQASVTQLMDNKNSELQKAKSNINESEGLVDEYAQKIKDQDDLIEQLIEEEIRRAEEAARKAEEERKAKEEAERKAREEAERKKREEEQRKQQNSGSQNNTGQSSNNSGGQSSDNGSGQTSSSSGFTWPLPSSRNITSYFGSRTSPTAGASSNHQGIDISAPNGTQIVAAASGTVSIAGYQWAAGNYIMISHGDGISTVYMHCSSLLVSAGQSVNKGQAIGLVGSTGVSTGNHLHFGVRVNGVYRNPLNYVS